MTKGMDSLLGVRQSGRVACSLETSMGAVASLPPQQQEPSWNHEWEERNIEKLLEMKGKGRSKEEEAKKNNNKKNPKSCMCQ